MPLMSCDYTFLGEKTPTVPPSSLMATPISASRASLKKSTVSAGIFSQDNVYRRLYGPTCKF